MTNPRRLSASVRQRDRRYALTERVIHLRASIFHAARADEYDRNGFPKLAEFERERASIAYEKSKPKGQT